MKNFTRILVLAWAACASAAAVGGDIIPSAAHETGSKTITLPPEIGGDAIWIPCSSCPTLRLATNAKTVFRLGDVPVSLATMRLELQRRPNELILLRNTPDDRVLVALVLSAAQ